MADNELIISSATKAVDVFAPGAARNFVAGIEKRARDEAAQHDGSTAASRATLVSLAHKVARSKTALDDMGKTLTEEWRVRTNAVNEERRMIRERLDALKEEIRAPVTEFEQREKNRIQAHEDALLEIISLGDLPHGCGRDEIENRLHALGDMQPRNWDEFATKATREKERAYAVLTAALAAELARKREQVELARLRSEAEARERKEREERIAAEAAEKARLEAERKAQEEREKAARAAEEQRKALERAQDAAAEAERARIEAEQRAAKEAAEAEARAQREREDAERKLIAAQKEAAEREEKLKAESAARAKAAAEAERARVEADAKRRAQEAEARARDIENKTRVLTEIKEALMKHAEIDEATAKAVTRAIHGGKIPHVRVEF